MGDGMFRRLGDWFRNFMIGRYGGDQLNKWLLILGVVLMLIGSIFGRNTPWAANLSLLAYVPLIWCIFRMYSRNIEARRRENAAFVNFFNHLKDKEHRYYRCPRCRQTVRVPRGRGKINIRCPKCGNQFVKTT